MILFDEYKLFVENTSLFSERRQTISNTYTAVNSLLLTAIGLLIRDAGFIFTWKMLLPLPLILAGIVICLWWRQLIQNNKSLVSLRIRILRKMEDELQNSVKMYHHEDELYPVDSKSLFADIESKLPLMFIALYLFFGIGFLIGYILNY